MNTIFKIITTIFIGLLPIMTVGQAIEYYKFSVSTSYLPSCGSQSELYSKVNGKLKRQATKRSWKHCKRIKKLKLPKDKNNEKAINILESLIKLEEFTFRVNPTLIETLKSCEFWKKSYNITDQNIDDFFKKKDTVTLKMSSIKQNGFEGIVIDGAPYWFELVIKREGKDTIKYIFDGNFLDGVQTSTIRYWLPMYLTYKEYPFFDSIKLVKEYFNDKQFESILFRFIVWTKEE